MTRTAMTCNCSAWTPMQWCNNRGHEIKEGIFNNFSLGPFIQRVRKFLLQTSRACRWDSVDNFLNGNPCPETYRFRAGGTTNCGPGGSSGKALSCGLDGPGSIPGVGGVEIFLRSFVSRLALGSTQPPMK